MNDNNVRISAGQLAAMTLIGDVFAVFCIRGNVTVMTAAGFAFGAILQYILSAPAVKNAAKGIEWGKAADMLYYIWLVGWGGMLFSMQWQTSRVIYIPYENSGGIWGKLLISGLIALVCLYISSTGIKAMARSAAIAAAIGGICIAVVSVTAFSSGNWENISRPEGGWLSEILRGFALSGGLGSFVVLMRLESGNVHRLSAVYFSAKAAVTMLLVFVSVLVAGGIMEITDFPIVTAAQLSQPFPVQRIDSLFVMVFAVFAVFSIAVQTVTAAWLLGKIFPKFKKYRSTFTLVLMIGAAFALNKVKTGSLCIAAALLVVLSGVPLVLLLKNRRKNA